MLAKSCLVRYGEAVPSPLACRVMRCCSRSAADECRDGRISIQDLPGQDIADRQSTEYVVGIIMTCVSSQPAKPALSCLVVGERTQGRFGCTPEAVKVPPRGQMIRNHGGPKGLLVWDDDLRMSPLFRFLQHNSFFSPASSRGAKLKPSKPDPRCVPRCRDDGYAARPESIVYLRLRCLAGRRFEQDLRQCLSLSLSLCSLSLCVWVCGYAFVCALFH